MKDGAVSHLHDMTVVLGALTAVSVAGRAVGEGQQDLQPHFLLPPFISRGEGQAGLSRVPITKARRGGGSGSDAEWRP